MALSAEHEIEALRSYLAEVNDPSVNPPVADARRAQARYGTAVPLPAGIERTCVTLGSVPTERLSPGDAGQRAFYSCTQGATRLGPPQITPLLPRIWR
jgi:hypothetical protein